MEYDGPLKSLGESFGTEFTNVRPLETRMKLVRVGNQTELILGSKWELTNTYRDSMPVNFGYVIFDQNGAVRIERPHEAPRHTVSSGNSKIVYGGRFLGRELNPQQLKMLAFVTDPRSSKNGDFAVYDFKPDLISGILNVSPPSETYLDQYIARNLFDL